MKDSQYQKWKSKLLTYPFPAIKVLWFSMSTKYSNVFGLISTHPLLDDRWITQSAITWGSYILSHINLCANTAPGVLCLYVNVIYPMWWTPCIEFGFWIETFIFKMGVIIQMTPVIIIISYAFCCCLAQRCPAMPRISVFHSQLWVFSTNDTSRMM